MPTIDDLIAQMNQLATDRAAADAAHATALTAVTAATEATTAESAAEAVEQATFDRLLADLNAFKNAPVVPPFPIDELLTRISEFRTTLPVATPVVVENKYVSNG